MDFTQVLNRRLTKIIRQPDDKVVIAVFLSGLLRVSCKQLVTFCQTVTLLSMEIVNTKLRVIMEYATVYRSS
jgi:hypothetical protein